MLAGGDTLLPEHLLLDVSAPPPLVDTRTPTSLEAHPAEVAAPAGFLPGGPPSPRSPPPDAPRSAEAAGGLRGELDAIERRRIVDALEQCAGNQTQAAALLGMPRRTFVARLSAYGIPRPRKGKAKG
ncbi:helix-turn-helix domain-containing protein [Sorangium cellulosum]|uniref:helix-turn-helix domain-containing protein n=1 Tax=Sorangium cellulosum TaxID=56 RepID=UPI003B8A5B67